MLKIGDIVIIRKDLHGGHDFKVFCHPKMTVYRGRTARILAVEEASRSRTFYRLCVDDKDWQWTEDMFEEVCQC
jgi:hypothetical protein